MSDQAEHSMPLRSYLVVWGWLFLLSVLSYGVDIAPLEGLAKWIPITVLMLLKAGLIMAVFMHMQWERLSLVTMILVLPGTLFFAMFVFGFEGAHILGMREQFFLNLEFFRVTP